jgi:hypothetical protein
MLYVDHYRRGRRFPVRLPYFLLERQEQWYPPFFPLLLALLPRKLFARCCDLISPVCDAVSCTLIYAMVRLQPAGPQAAVIASLSYVLLPFAIWYNVQLNPRSLANLVLSLVLLLLFWSPSSMGAVTTGIACLLGGTLLLCHKMTSQLMVVVLITLSIALSDLQALIVLVTAPIAAMLFSCGFYRKVLRAHFDIVRFWNRNRAYVNAHQFHESNLYRRRDYCTRRFHQPGIVGVVRHLKRICGAHPFFISAMLWGWWNLRLLDRWQLMCLIYVTATYAWAMATTFVPWLRCLGAGFYYTYNAAFPAAFLVAAIPTSWPWLLALLLPGTFALWATAVVLMRLLRSPLALGAEPELAQACTALKTLNSRVVMCLPTPLAEPVAYLTRCKVMWGGHGYGFRSLEPFWPVITKPLPELLESYQVDTILADHRYLSENELTRLAPGWKVTQRIGVYLLLRKEVSNS